MEPSLGHIRKRYRFYNGYSTSFHWTFDRLGIEFDALGAELIDRSANLRDGGAAQYDALGSLAQGPKYARKAKS